MLRNTLILLATLGVGSLLLGVALVAFSPVIPRNVPPPVPPAGPEGGGLADAAGPAAIDLGRRYDFHCSLGEPGPTVFRGCRVLGFTRGLRHPAADGFPAPGGPGSSGPYTGGLSSPSADQDGEFAGWLVLESEDGRTVYVPPRSVVFFAADRVPER